MITVFAKNTMSNPAPYLPPIMSDVVFDISHYENVSQDFVTTAQAGIAAVILKATQGTGFVDPTFLPRVAEARAAGLLVGAYHFLDGSSPAEQAAHFLTVAVSEGMVKWLALDWEPYPASPANVMQARPICPPGFTAWRLWQHTDGQVGSAVVPVPGVGACDRSKFAGTVDQLRAWWSALASS
jgi:lysozyme